MASESSTSNQSEAGSVKSESEQSTDNTTDMVWIAATGSKYHRINNCGRMNPDTAKQVTREEAVSMGMEPCKKCYKKIVEKLSAFLLFFWWYVFN